MTNEKSQLEKEKNAARLVDLLTRRALIGHHFEYSNSDDPRYSRGRHPRYYCHALYPSGFDVVLNRSQINLIDLVRFIDSRATYKRRDKQQFKSIFHVRSMPAESPKKVIIAPFWSRHECDLLEISIDSRYTDTKEIENGLLVKLRLPSHYVRHKVVLSSFDQEQLDVEIWKTSLFEYYQRRREEGWDYSSEDLLFYLDCIQVNPNTGLANYGLDCQIAGRDARNELVKTLREKAGQPYD